MLVSIYLFKNANFVSSSAIKFAIRSYVAYFFPTTLDFYELFVNYFKLYSTDSIPTTVFDIESQREIKLHYSFFIKLSSRL